jgi:DNA (cytosine-5)-methyltransferase 1
MRAPLVRLFDDVAGVDLFAGGGGASEGIKQALGRSPKVAINHDADALGMHEINHPETTHLRGDVFHYDPDTVAIEQNDGRPFAYAWFSPDCTFHSKAKGGVPFRDRRRSVRTRGLAWVMVHWAESTIAKPRLLFMENVQEWWDWCRLIEVAPGEWRPDPSRKGEYRRRLLKRLERAGYVWQVRRLRAMQYGAPTIRERLFLIARCDGLPIVWPEPTHGPTLLKPYRGAHECIDFSLPMPSIFLTRDGAKAWGREHGVPAPKRPLATATCRRVARGVMRYVVDCADPFIVSNMTNNVPTSVREPVSTILTGNHKYLVVPSLINTRNGERLGQAPRVHDIRQPYPTVTSLGSQGALVAAFLAKHNGGHEATGQRLDRPADTIVCRENKALVAATLLRYNGEKGEQFRGQDPREPIRTLDTSNRYGLVAANLVHLRGGLHDHLNTSSDVRSPHPTITAHGTHAALVAGFLVKYFGTGVSRSLWSPAGAVTTKDRFGLVLVTIESDTYALVDILMRMLTPRELFLLNGFGRHYVIDRGLVNGQVKHFTKATQTRLCGNSVPPDFARELAAANLGTWREEQTA